MTYNSGGRERPFDSVLVELSRQRDIADDTIRALEASQAVLKERGVLRANWNGIERMEHGLSLGKLDVLQLMEDEQRATVAAYEFLEIELAACLREMHGRISSYVELAVFTGADRGSILLACGRSLSKIETALARMELLGV
ncbi:MAG: hypothetical protein ACYCZY_13570 [Lacisediminihabitans sp.]